MGGGWFWGGYFGGFERFLEVFCLLVGGRLTLSGVFLAGVVLAIRVLRFLGLVGKRLKPMGEAEVVFVYGVWFIWREVDGREGVLKGMSRESGWVKGVFL